jgi:hypothetical protein
MSMYTLYETQYPGQQKEPVGFFGNDFGGNINRPVLNDYKVVGRIGNELWLQSKTGDSSDSIQINFATDYRNFDHVFMNKIASFKGELQWDYTVGRHYYSWTCTALSY